MLVSVIISNYNYARYIKESVESVINQTYKNFELFIVDDGSSDDSLVRINELQKLYPNIIKVIAKKNGGQASAFNNGFEAASGDIIAFLDADDYWYPTKLETIVKYHSEYPAIQHNLLINNTKKFTNLDDQVCKQKKLLENYGFMGTIPTSGLSFKKDAIKHLFPIPEKEYRICADLYIKIMYLNNGDIFSINDSLGCYRAHDSNNWFNSQFSSMEYNEDTLNLLNKKRIEGKKPEINKESEALTFAKVFISSFNLNKNENYIIFGNGGLGTAIYNLIHKDYNIKAFSNSFVSECSKHNGLDLVSIDYIKENYPNTKILIASTQFIEVIDTLLNAGFNMDHIMIPKL